MKIQLGVKYVFSSLSALCTQAFVAFLFSIHLCQTPYCISLAK